jgi:hypothetical protein
LAHPGRPVIHAAEKVVSDKKICLKRGSCAAYPAGRGESVPAAAPEQHNTTSRLTPTRAGGDPIAAQERKESRVNYSPKNLPKSALPEVVDILLADIAIRIQLTKTNHTRRSTASR